MLHIYARHVTRIEDALAVFFDADAEQRWNEESGRFERFSDGYGLYWFWLETDAAVMVITCFKEAP